MTQEPRNCWEFMNCIGMVKHSCPAFEHQMGRDCWMIAAEHQGAGCPQARDRGLDYCTEECLWYKKLNAQTA